MQLTFLYHALASGLSGQITLPFQHTIAVQAPSALPYTGGYSASRAEAFRHEQLVSFDSAETVTTGSESNGVFSTLATAVIEGLNILNVVTADRVVARLASKYSKQTGLRSVTFPGSHFVNLRIAGFPFEPRIDPEQMNFPRKSDRVRVGSIAAPVNLEGCKGLERLADGAIHLPEFGKVYLAECLVTACYQSLSMVRVDLGCAVKGHVMIAFASTDGEPMPG